MDIAVLAIATFLIFSLSARVLLLQVVSPLPIDNRTPYSKKALRLSKYYKIFAWGLLTLTMLIAMFLAYYDALSADRLLV